MKNLYLPSLGYKGVEDFTSDKGIKIRRFVSPAFRLSCKYAFDYKVVLDGYPNLEKDKPYIFSTNHGFVEDIQALLATMDRHGYILTGAYDQLENHPNFYGIFINGFIMVDRTDKKSRNEAIPKMARIIKNGSSVVIYPEGAWNTSENMLVMPLFKGPYLLANSLKNDGLTTEVVPVSQLKDEKNKTIYVKFGNPFDITKYEVKEGLTVLRDEMATLTWDLMEKYFNYKREELPEDPSYAFMLEKANEFITGKWTKDIYDEEIIMYKDKNIPYKDDVLNSFKDVDITKENAHLIAPILAEIERLKKYDLKSYMHEYHNEKVKKLKK